MKYFTITQFSASSDAQKNGINNQMPNQYAENAKELIEKILDPLREAWGSNISITSGYRSQQLNKLIKGASDSAHLYGYAADIVPSNGKIDEFKDFTAKFLKSRNIAFDQYIDEQNKEGAKWVHIGIRNNRGQQRKQYLIFNDDGNGYGKINPNQHSASTNTQNNSPAAGGDVIAKHAKLLTSKAVIEKEKYTIDYLTSNGITVYSAAALCAIFTYECGFNANVYNKLEYSGKGVSGTGGWNCGEGLIGWTYAAKAKMKLIKDSGWDVEYGISTNVSEYLKDSAKHIYTIPFEGQVKGLIPWYKMCGKYNALSSAQDYQTAISVVYSCVAGCKANWDACVACGDKYVKTHTEQARAAGRNTVYYNGFLLRAETCRRILNRYQPGLGGDAPVSGGYSGSNGGGYGSTTGTTAGSSYSGLNNGPQHVQYPAIDARAISTGGSTQTGSTAGALKGRNVYLNTIDEKEVQNNSIYSKDESGQPIFDSNGQIKTNENYLYTDSEQETSINDVNDLPDYTAKEYDEQTGEYNYENYEHEGAESLVINKKLTNDEKENLKEENRKKSIEKWNKKQKDLSLEQAKEKLLEWLSTQSIIIQNAFHLIIIKDMIDKIKVFLDQLKNTSIENQADLLNTLTDILGIFEDLGLTPDAQGITLDDLKKLGMAAAGTVVETAVDLGNQVQAKAMEATQEMIDQQTANIIENGGQVLSTNIIQDAKATVAKVTDTAQSFAEQSVNGVMNAVDVAKNTVKATATDIATSMVDQTVNTVIDAGNNIDLNSIANTAENMLKNNVSSAVTEPFVFVQTNQDKNINIDIIIFKNPSMHLIKITSFIKKFKYGDNKQIFNNGATKIIKDAFKEAWEINDTVTTEINAIVDGVTKHYIFTINVDKSSRNNEETNGNTTQISTNLFDTGKISSAAGGLVSTAEGLISDASSMVTGAIDQAKSIGNDIKNQASNIAETAKGLGDTATNIGKGALDTAKNVGKDALSSLTDVNINIDMSLIEEVLKGKVMMFDQVVQFLKILQPVIEVLKVICHLLENYQINKEFVKQKRHVDLNNAIKKAAQLINGLKDMLDLKDTNFFTIRTKEMSEWAIKEFNQQPDDAGFIVIDILGTTTLNTYLSLHAINPDCPLDLLKGTTLYFDNWGIENGGFNDGTSNGLDNIEINRGLGEIYYDKNNKSTISSEILRARKRNIDPKYVDINIPEEADDSIESLLKLVSFKSDEVEGTQTLDFNNLNLCPQPPAQVSKPGKSAVIVEFGDEYTLGNRVEYTLNIKPGQAINENDIIAYITKDGVQTPLRTQFTGTVRAKDTYNNDYYHLYPSAASRHFIIDDAVPCMAVDYNVNDVMDLQKKFKKSSELESFILNCMPISILPILLSKADRNNKNSAQTIPPIPGMTQIPTGVYSKYDQIIQNFDTAISNYAEMLKNVCSADRIKGGSTDGFIFDKKEYTNISTHSTEDVMNEIKSIRQNMIDAAISVYTNVTNINDNSDLQGDYTYADCIGLAYDNNISFTRGADDKIDYNNYYINLLQTIPDSQKMQMPTMDINMSDIQGQLEKMHLTDDDRAAGKHIDMDSNPFFNIKNAMSQLSNSFKDDEDDVNYINEYRELIKNIIDTRLSYEKQTKNSIIEQFNIYYNKFIKPINNAFENLKNRISDLTNKEEILKQIKIDRLGKYYNLNEKADQDKFRTDDSEKLKDDKHYYNECQQALTMFMYLVNSNIDESVQRYSQITTNKIETQQDKNAILYTINQVSKNYFNDNDTILYNDIEYTDLYNLIVSIISNIQDDKQIEAVAKVINLNKDEISYLIDLIHALDNSDNEVNNDSIVYLNRKLNEFFYELTVSEAKTIETFWNKVLDDYKIYNIDESIKSIKEYANNMNSATKWPQSINIKVEQTSYELYTFTDPIKQEKEIPDNIPFAEINMDDLKLPAEMPEPTIDLADTKDIRENDPITIFDYEYWLVYMLNATLFTLNPMFWADGFDIPPFMTPLLLPAIYVPIAPPVMIPKVDVLMVFGIALRGIWPAPIILMVNLSSSDVDVMVFLKIALQIAKDMFKQAQEFVENGVPSMVNEMLRGYVLENEIALKAIDKFRTYASIIHSIPIENKALIEKRFNEELQNEMNSQVLLKMSEANSKIQSAQDTIKESKEEAMKTINKNVNSENIQKKLMKYDRRQVVTREADLGDGPEPM